ncbi:HpcH/HpaI aldolase/citrate lyase family protein [Pusillimonas noertemannii]|uniref:HpcH/HpaI aldolase/citrate lyase family protein n=1 Tax=Pusillimonas noertemannii TaxID=305977 RepID=UPI00334095C3
MALSTASSFLFVPADRPERFPKALQSGAQAVILDLEDAIAPENKHRAREAISQCYRREKNVMVRINGVGTPWHDEDIQLCKQIEVAGIMVPKAESARVLQVLVSHLKTDIALFPLIETAAGMADARDIAQAPQVERLVFGTLDFQLDLHIEDDDEGLLHFRSHLVLASRLAGLNGPIDGVTTDFNNASQTERDTARAKRLGFSGKLCIHPRQVSVVNQGFLPTDAELKWALQIVQGATSNSAVAVGEQMVDRPVLLRARRILERGKHET